MTRTLPTRTTHVLLDLDGTLTDSAPGIVASLRAGFADAGFAVPSDEVLRTFVGPPLGASMARVGLAGADAEAAIAAYRRDFEARGMFDNSVFPGITDALTELREAGATLLVATAKPENYARQIVEHFGLDAYLARGLDGVHGADPEAVHETAGKEVVVERALATAVALGAERGQVVMVGDREHDVHAAAHHGLPTVGVAWGYAEPGELEAAGAAAVAATPAELRKLLTS
ncbi:HAD hydrolase-like protein [Promicromonospora citrea]|uniref:5'-nucleotidase n=1 Tax=Promicromonospora citrea TaxID=43677 RepID=A0A8H9GG89_9MICO|nr:HAD hydrolase-like protein [Promicromonospora citrea]NNH53750.1 HAD hydrolase-like protein [Promicromonospora citrea]GGM23197.1 5'-nucleotidase [Promicromonospora citrea]